MKVLLFSNLVPSKSGAFEHFLAALGAALKAHGDAIMAVFAGEPTVEVAEWLAVGGVRWRVIPEWCGPDDTVHPWRFVLPALRIEREERPDVVAVNFGNELPTVATKLLAGWGHGSRARWVWQQHQRIVEASGLNRNLSRIRLVGAVCDHIVALYAGGRTSIERRGVAPNRISVIHNGIVEQRSERPAGWLRAELRLEPGRVLAATVGSLIARKRIGFQLKALAQMGPPMDLVVCGIGAEAEPLRREAERLGVASRVHWFGQRNDVTDILHAADLLLHSALAEASPYVILEAMAAGIPVVATASGAIPEQVENGKTGFVVAEDDSNAFVALVERLCSDAGLRRQMGAAARERWREHFTEAACVDRYVALYQALVGERQVASRSV